MLFTNGIKFFTTKLVLNLCMAYIDVLCSAKIYKWVVFNFCFAAHKAYSVFPDNFNILVVQWDSSN